MFFENFKQTIFENQRFYISFIIIWSIGLYYQFTYSQFDLSIWVNGWHTPIGDMIMVGMTNAGDGIFLVAIGLLLILLKRKYWLVVLLCLTIPSLITQLLKHQVFAHHFRPSLAMKDIPNLYFVEGVKMNQYNSFPSGHTTAAFSLYTLIALMISGKRFGFVWPLIAALVGLSRVYLLQHFWEDILAGAIVGLLSCTILFVALKPKENAV